MAFPGNRMLHEDITYWAPNGTNEFSQPTFAGPVLVKGRWEDNIQKVMKNSGEEYVSTSQVYLSQDAAVGGQLMRGDQTATAQPPTDAREIQQYHTIPDLRNVSRQRIAYL